MKKIIVSILFLLLVFVVLLSYLGVFPVFSSYLSKPVDLGVAADKSLVTAFEAKYGKPNGTGKVDLDVDLSSEEVTSIFAVWEDRDPNFPLHGVQVKFNPDGSGEASGYLNIATAVGLAKNLGYSETDIEKGKKYINYINGDLSFYVKGTGGMINNNLSIQPSAFQIGRVTVPESISVPAASLVEDMIDRRLNQIGGADIQEAVIKSGVFHLDGSVPETIEYE